MKVTFIYPCVGKRPGEAYPNSWLMEPLAIAQLSALTPPSWERVFYDDRFDSIPYDDPTDLVALSVETYSARRAYQISARFRERGVRVVMGGFHPTLAPEDAASHADALVVGEAEGVWATLLDDFEAGRLQPHYEASSHPDLAGIFPDRKLFAGKRYMNLALVETARGCRFNCDFCSISSFYNHSYSARPVGDVVQEITSLRKKNVFFVDDNLCVERDRALALFRALEPLGIRWVGQISVHVAGDDECLEAMRHSGCLGVLVGFETLNPGGNAVSGKALKGSLRPVYEKAVAQFARHRIGIYGTFVFGYDSDTRETLRETADFALRHRLFFSAFNHLVPFPGTPLFERLSDEKRLLQEKWWLSPHYHFGDVAFQPALLSPEELSLACFEARHSFYGWRRILRRALNWRSNCRSPFMTVLFWLSNLNARREVEKRQGLPLGVDE
ncbi:MAG TPA: radical SAM protein [Candidatus Sumerlaeota bacterium]|nr:radical SAM protein [Candidatus Sumerlaeota bacterium]HPS01894.1 radical SAM protein [Candidatus Sumerlaeota bacterium]